MRWRLCVGEASDHVPRHVGNEDADNARRMPYGDVTVIGYNGPRSRLSDAVV